MRENWIPYRIALLGNYGTDLQPAAGDQPLPARPGPYGTAAFVRMGVERGEVRSDIDEAMIVSMMEWTVERFQDALLTEELDPGLFSRQGNRAEKTAARIDQFLELLTGAVARDAAPIRAARPRRERKA